MRGRLHMLVLVLALAACGDHELVVNTEPEEVPESPAPSQQRHTSGRDIVATVDAYRPGWSDSIEHVVILEEGRTDKSAEVWVLLRNGQEWKLDVERDDSTWTVAEAAAGQDPVIAPSYAILPQSDGSSTDPTYVGYVEHSNYVTRDRKYFDFIPIPGEHTDRVLFVSNSGEEGVWNANDIPGKYHQYVEYGGATWLATPAALEPWLVCYDRAEAWQDNNLSGYHCETTNFTTWYADNLFPTGPAGNQIKAKRIDLTYDVQLVQAFDDTVASVTITPTPVQLSLSQVKAFTAKALNASNQEISGKVATWYIADSTVATVTKTGNLTADVTARGLGTTDIIATIDGISTQLTLSVHPVDITVSPANPVIELNSAQQLTAVVSSVDGTELSSGTVEWSSSNSNVVTVNRTGSRTATVTAVGVGSANVTAEVLGSSKTVPVEVTYPPVSADISGPGYVNTSGPHTWTAEPSGGDDSYTYLWEINYPEHSTGWGWLGNGRSVTFGVSSDDGDIMLRVTVTSAGMSDTVTRSVRNGVWGPGCPPPQIICE